MPKAYITDLKEGEPFISFFAVRSKQLRHHEGQPFLVLDLGDKTGRLRGTVWQEADQLKDVVKKGDVAKVKGKLIRYKDALEIRAEKLRKARRKEYDLADFLKTSDRDPEEAYQSIQKKCDVVKDKHLRGLLRQCFSDAELVERFKTAPAGKRWHHAYLGGLMEHTLAVTELCDAAAALYPLADSSLLATGALLHDIGNIEAYECTTFIDYTDIGRLQGHVLLGAGLVEDKIEQVPRFPAELKLRLMHLILSHHRELRYGSPVVPMTLEAMVLAYANELDMKTGAFTRVIEREKESGSTWSQWVNLIDRYIYFGENAQAQEEEPAEEEGP